MPTTTLKVELRLNYKSEEKLDDCLKVMLEHAREVFTQIYFMHDGTAPPQCVVTSEGSFTPITRFDINEDTEELNQ